MNGKHLKKLVHPCAISGKLLLLLCCISLWLTSCNDEIFVKEFRVSATEFDMNGEGDSAVIRVNNSHWTIIGVERQTSFQDLNVISGEFYNEDGQIVMTDVPFSYINNDKLGKMVYSNHVNGLTITTDTENRLRVHTNENLSAANFDFTIWLGDNYKSIPLHFSQKPSAGFTFDHIEYNLEPESCYTNFKTKEIIYNNMGADIDVEYYIFSGVSMKTVFYSDDKKTFNYLGENYRMEIPTGVRNDTFQYSGTKVPFNRDVHHTVTDLSDITKQVTIPQGESKIKTNIEYLNFESSFKLYLHNNATNDIKTVAGSLQCQMPTGSYYLFINDRWIK